MARNDTKHMESVIAVSEELSFTLAAQKTHISQPMLTRNVAEVEGNLGVRLFERNRKTVKVTDAGRAYVEQARLSLLYGERAVQAARAVMQGADVPLYVGRSPYTDPFLVTILRAIELPLFPRLRIELGSQYSCDLVHHLLAGALDLAIATEPQESLMLTKVKVADSPFYIAMAKGDELTDYPSIELEMMANRRWILFERRLHPPLYDSILRAAEQANVTPSKLQHMTAPEEAFPFVVEGAAIAFLVKAGALLMARNGVTIRPLAHPELRLRTYLVSRADNKSKVASEVVRAFMRRISDVSKYRQLHLPIFA